MAFLLVAFDAICGWLQELLGIAESYSGLGRATPKAACRYLVRVTPEGSCSLRMCPLRSPVTLKPRAGAAALPCAGRSLYVFQAPSGTTVANFTRIPILPRGARHEH